MCICQAVGPWAGFLLSRWGAGEEHPQEGRMTWAVSGVCEQKLGWGCGGNGGAPVELMGKGGSWRGVLGGGASSTEAPTEAGRHAFRAGRPPVAGGRDSALLSSQEPGIQRRLRTRQGRTRRRLAPPGPTAAPSGGWALCWAEERSGLGLGHPRTSSPRPSEAACLSTTLAVWVS